MNRVPKFKYPVKLDIGCGEYLERGFVGLDIYDCGQDVLWDVRGGIPFPDESVSEIHTTHFLEHLSDDEIYPFISECMRVLVKRGKMVNRLPYWTSDTAFMTNHKSVWNEIKVQTLYNPRKPIPMFKILENRSTSTELFFTLEKL